MSFGGSPRKLSSLSWVSVVIASSGSGEGKEPEELQNQRPSGLGHQLWTHLSGLALIALVSEAKHEDNNSTKYNCEA